MAHVSWPTRTQTVAFTLLVVLISLFVAVYLSVFDGIFTNGLRIALDHAPRFTESVTNPALDLEVASTTDASTSSPTASTTAE